ncbi:MAG TPA: hypothetical protein VGM31_09225 [Puia sp.]|jgi:1,2-phenylacetyl-CoA epoxidase catalytic subunit
MGVLKKIQYDCRHATYLIEKRQERTLTLKERVQLAIHLWGCSVCRLFQHQSRVINLALKDLFQGSSKSDHVLDDKFKRDMQEKINERLPK